MVPLGFPLLLAAPALAMDLIARRLDAAAGWAQRWLHALALGLAFLGVFAAVQVPLSRFLLSDAGRNALFLEGRFPYDLPMSNPWVRGELFPYRGTPGELAVSLAWAALGAVLATRAGLAWGAWMRGVRR